MTDDFSRAQSLLAELADLKEQADEIERRRRQLSAQLRDLRRGAQARPKVAVPPRDVAGERRAMAERERDTTNVRANLSTNGAGTNSGNAEGADLMLSRQEEDRERREVLHNDALVRQQREQGSRVYAPDQSKPNPGTTLHQAAINDADIPLGRFSAISAAVVVGSKADVAGAYPAASAHQHDPVGPEPPLGYAIDAMPALEASADEPQATDPTSAPSSPLGRVGSLSSDELGRGPSSLNPEHVPGSPHPFRRF